MPKYAAQIDENGDVEQVIVIPSVEDAAAYTAALGLAGTWVPAEQDAKCAGIGQRLHEGRFYAHWYQVPGADAGGEDEPSGYQTGREVWHNGAVRVSKIDFNVNEPLDDAPTTWSRKDGQYVIPAGWQYQPGEDLTDDGGATG